MYQGFFINLAGNETRRKSLSKHLEEIGAASRYQRIEAVEGRTVAHQYQSKLEPGALGCWLSHLNILRANSGAKTHLHVIEDDTIFARNAASEFDDLLKFAETEYSDWDLIFTDIYIVPADVQAGRHLSKMLLKSQKTKSTLLLNLQRIAFAGTSSYFVNWRSIDKYTKLISSPDPDGVPIDLHLRKLVNQKLLKAYVTMPFQTSVSPDSLQSDISGEIGRSRAVYHTFRRAYFRDADVPSLDAEMQKLIQGVGLSPVEILHLKALLFTLSDQYVDF